MAVKYRAQWWFAILWVDRPEIVRWGQYTKELGTSWSEGVFEPRTKHMWAGPPESTPGFNPEWEVVWGTETEFELRGE